MNIDYKDIRVDPIWNGSSWFPQYNGVRVTHIPSGISAECTEGRSQHRNQFDAMEKLKEALKDWVEPVGDKIIMFLRLEYKGTDYDRIYKVLHELNSKFPDIQVEKVSVPK